MIQSKEDYLQVEAMMQTDGWKLFREHAEQVSGGFLKRALALDDKDEVMIELTKYKAIKSLVQGVYGDFKTNYEKYNGVE